MSSNFATLLISNEEISLLVFKPSGSKVIFEKAVSEKISDPRDHKQIQKTLNNIRTKNPDLPKHFFAVWPEYKTLTGVFKSVNKLSQDEIIAKVKEKYSLTSQDIEIVTEPVGDADLQVTVFPSETRALYQKYAKDLQMEFLGFAPVVVGMEKFANTASAFLALKTSQHYVIAAVNSSGVFYSETINSPDPLELVTRLSKAIDFVQNKEDLRLKITKVILIGFPKNPEIKLPAKISVIRKPIIVENLTGDDKSLYLESILSARLVVKNLPQESVLENNKEEKDSKESGSEPEPSAHQELEEKEDKKMSEEYTNENENEDTLRRLNDSRDYRYYDEETTSWKAWLVGVIIILIVLFLVIGVLARAGYLPFNVPFFSPASTAETVTPTPTPAPIQQTVVQPTAAPAATSSASVKKDEFTVQVLNGSGKAGAAGTVSKSLDEAKYDTITPTNAPTEDYTSTQVYNVGKASGDFLTALIADLKKAGYTATDSGTKLPADVKSTADVVVILGSK